ncbi:NAD-dependent epimerase/dehydratase family protein [Aggregatimonas sangjinii]|uniref:NAD-dependent epimerase/dehydratase family protein n=2 Tax=Aggregatimonas sangjinii TaxID=2583587 RepID=A0A5B7SZJ1_9FLAO|nr:NAD-dependent epimerase/dehydratase family protein [Aggregatimonas sangjinii]
MIGATGAVGGHTVKELLQMPEIGKLTLLGRRTVPYLVSKVVDQYKINLFDPSSYAELVSGHQTAICTLGVGQSSKVSKEDFIKIDKQAVLDFAQECKKSGITHFELLASVGTSTESSSFYLRTKGELVEALKEMRFERLSVFQPSMILTPTNRYGFSQGVLLKFWPLLKPFLFGRLRKYRGVKVTDLGRAIARNVLTPKKREEYLVWDDFERLTK